MVDGRPVGIQTESEEGRRDPYDAGGVAVAIIERRWSAWMLNRSVYSKRLTSPTPFSLVSNLHTPLPHPQSVQPLIGQSDPLLIISSVTWLPHSASET